MNHQNIEMLEHTVSDLKKDVSELKQDVRELKVDVTNVRVNLAEIKGDVTAINAELKHFATHADITKLFIWMVSVGIGTIGLGLLNYIK